MDPVTMALIFGGVNMLKGQGQQKQQQALDEVDAKWAPFSGQKHSKAADQSPWINDLMALGFLANGRGSKTAGPSPEASGSNLWEDALREKGKVGTDALPNDWMMA